MVHVIRELWSIEFLDTDDRQQHRMRLLVHQAAHLAVNQITHLRRTRRSHIFVNGTHVVVVKCSDNSIITITTMSNPVLLHTLRTIHTTLTLLAALADGSHHHALHRNVPHLEALSAGDDALPHRRRSAPHLFQPRGREQCLCRFFQLNGAHDGEGRGGCCYEGRG